MDVSKTAIVIFVKTIGLSPLKTRLGKDIGKEDAEAFYRHSFQTIEQTLLDFSSNETHSKVTPIWAIAEPEALDHIEWANFQKIVQPAGDLGEKLNYIYQQLLPDFEQIIFIGADAPQITCEDFKSAITALESNTFALGPATDGGYWLFAGKKDIPKTAWTSVRYSSQHTAADFTNNLMPFGNMAILNEKMDVDTKQDLKELTSKFLNTEDISVYFEKLLSWTKKNIEF